MDSYVLALGQKKAVQRMQKEYEDLVSCHHHCSWQTSSEPRFFPQSNYCPTVRPGSKNSLDETFWVLSEIPEATSAVLSHTTLQFLNKHASAIESLHISDQYTGFVQNKSVLLTALTHTSVSWQLVPPAVRTLRLWWSDNRRKEYR